MLLSHYPTVISKMEILCVMYPHHVYHHDKGDTACFSRVKEYWYSRGVKIEYKTVPESDFDDNDKEGCRTCKKLRKSVIDPYVYERPTNTGLITGLTLYDVLAYISIVYFHTRLNLENFPKLSDGIKCGLIKTLHKVRSYEYLPSGKIMIRPLLRFTETEIIDYLNEKKIPYVNTPCKIGPYKFKRPFSEALNVFQGNLPTYDDVVSTLERHGIIFDELPFDEMANDSFFIDC
jgi:hypothetical protein